MPALRWAEVHRFRRGIAERQGGSVVVDDKGARVLIDPKAILFLIGTEMDFVKDKLQSRFVFNNPNQTDACGCGESVALKAASGAD